MNVLFRSLARLTAAAALIVACGAALPAAARDMKASVDAKAGVITMTGWSRRVAETTTIFYTCEDDSCGRGSIVSMRRQMKPNALDGETLRRNENRVAEAIRERAGGKIARIEIGDPVSSKDAKLSVGEITRVIVPNSGEDVGLHLNWKSGYVTTPEFTYTLAGSSDSRAHCDANYNAFKAALMLMGARK
ncbi:MAG: hypothetical protein ABWZ80_10190 [Beijerinckiaceae bacterium]